MRDRGGRPSSWSWRLWRRDRALEGRPLFERGDAFIRSVSGIANTYIVYVRQRFCTKIVKQLFVRETNYGTAFKFH